MTTELEFAVENVLGKDAYDALVSARVSLPQRQQAACITVFIGAQGPATTPRDICTIRDSMKYLFDHGSYRKED